MAEKIFLFPSVRSSHRLQAHQEHDYSSRKVMQITEHTIGRFNIDMQYFSRKDIADLAPEKTGVYVLYKFNQKSRILEVYIGRSKDLKNRINQHAANQDKAWFTHGVVIHMEGDLALNDVENALYSNFKCRANIIMHNDKIPEVDNDRGKTNNVLLERVDVISYLLISKTFGSMSDEFRIRQEILNQDKTVFTYMKSVKGNVSLKKMPNLQTGIILEGSLIVIPDKMEDSKKTALQKFLKDTSNKQLIEHSGEEVIYRFTEDKKINLYQFKLLFGENIQDDLWMHSLGETRKLQWIKA